MTNRTKSELISHCRIAANRNCVELLLFPARWAHTHYSSRMIDRFPNWGDHGKPKGGEIKGRCQPPLALSYFIASSAKEACRKAGLKHKLKLKAWRLRIQFRDTLILVFVNENGCLCISFTELYFFYWLLVVSRVILIAVPFVFSRSVNIACRRYSKCRAYQTLLKITDQYWKPSNKKITIIHSLCWNVTLLMFIQTRPQLALQKWFWKFF